MVCFQFHTALSEILLTACADQLLYNSRLIKLCSACAKQMQAVSKRKRCLFIISKIDIIWSSWTKSKFINYQLWTSHKIFLSLKYLFHFFPTSCWLHLFTKYWRVTSCKYSRSNIVRTSFLWYVAGFSTPTKENVLCQRDLDKHF